MRLRIIKLGGSVLRRHDGFGLLQDWWKLQPLGASVLIVGGGELADAVRGLEQRGGVTSESAHWLAVRAMTLMAWTFSHFDPRWSFVDDWQQLQSLLWGGMLENPPSVVFDPTQLLRGDANEGSPRSLPMGWQVTSDSIAAQVARRLNADELVLLKSTLPTTTDVNEASRLGFVDAYFPQAAHGIDVIRCVDLPGRTDVLWCGTPAMAEPTTTIDRPRVAFPRGTAQRVE